MDKLISLSSRLLEAIRAEQFAGYDSHDSLNSPLLRGTPLYRSARLRQAWLQLGKRSPINLRPLLRVPKQRNPKAVGLFISGLLQDYQRTDDPFYWRQAGELAGWLLTQRSDARQWGHSCWGYHFDSQEREFYVPAGKPDIVTTCYVARALYELGEVSAGRALTDVALDAARFISTQLYTEAGGRRFYAAMPGERELVHSASLWGAAWCAFAGQQLGDAALVAQAMQVARTSVKEQGADGSWVHGARGAYQLVVGFHTGYCLEALCLLRDATGSREFDGSIRRGYGYYVNAFFSADGTAKYFYDSVYPIEMHSFAQAIFTLLKVGGTARDVRLCAKVVQRAIDLLYLPREGQFIYQKTRWLTNRIRYSRCTEAWAYSAMAFYNRYRTELSDAKK